MKSVYVKIKPIEIDKSEPDSRLWKHMKRNLELNFKRAELQERGGNNVNANKRLR